MGLCQTVDQHISTHICVYIYNHLFLVVTIYIYIYTLEPAKIGRTLEASSMNHIWRQVYQKYFETGPLAVVPQLHWQGWAPQP